LSERANPVSGIWHLASVWAGWGPIWHTRHRMAESPDQTNTTSRLVPAIVTALAGLWTAGVVLAPWLSAHDSILGSWLRLVYRPGCHQITDRCLDLGFGPLAVCARCAGLYLGGLLGLLWTVVRNRASRPRPMWLVVVAAPTVIDFAAGEIGLPSAGNWLRFSLALPLGLLAGLYLGDALVEIVRRNSPQKAEYRRPDSVG
jgi:uncharacterized membrane protein